MFKQILTLLIFALNAAVYTFTSHRIVQIKKKSIYQASFSSNATKAFLKKYLTLANNVSSAPPLPSPALPAR